jgi:hypothetical protein
MIVFKYTNRIEILENGTLRFTQPDQLNDPLESHPNFNELIEDIKKRNTTGLNSTTASKISNAIEETAPHVIASLLRDLNIGFLSLTNIPDNELMWSHYADSHKGFVLGFDGDHQFFKRDNPRKITGLRPVKYSSTRIIPPDAGFVPSDLAEVLFFTKSTDWSYEEEVRVMADLANADIKPTTLDGMYFFKFPPEALLQVIFGIKTPESVKQAVLKLTSIKYPNARLLQREFDVISSAFRTVAYDPTP